MNLHEIGSPINGILGVTLIDRKALSLIKQPGENSALSHAVVSLSSARYVADVIQLEQNVRRLNRR